METIKINNDNVKIILSKQLYEKSAVFSAMYKLTGRCIAQISPLGEYDVEVTLSPQTGSGYSVEDIKGLAESFLNDIIDQQLRLDLEKQYGRLRELIVEHAFTPIKNLDQRLNDI
ncbi:MAG TPA: His-Xaa-Ser system protein HxsD [Syntrophales bacterium]|nr:His-Xaa-Ser system protein HxsD [Syntrophales bacterium]